MVTTFFEEVGTIVKERTGDGTLTKEQFQEVSTKRTLVAGFPSTETVVKELSGEEIQKKEQRVKQSLQSAGELEDELAEVDVKPIAILPKRLLKQLFVEFQIIDLGKITGGVAKAEEQNVKTAVQKLSSPTMFAIIGGIVVLIGAGLGLFFLKAMLNPVSLGLGMLIVGSLFLGGLFFFTRPSNKQLAQTLWPNYSASGYENVLVAFPKLPESLQPILDRLNPFKDRICIAADPGAITVNINKHLKNTKKMDQAAWQEKIAEQRRLRQMRADDPIAYIPSSDGSMCAVLFQFGHFPKEKELIERVKNMTNNELFSFF